MKKRNIFIVIVVIIFVILIFIKYNDSLLEAKNEGYKKGNSEGYVKGMIDEKYASIWTDCMISCKAVANESYENKLCVKECMRNSEVPEDFINKHVL